MYIEKMLKFDQPFKKIFVFENTSQFILNNKVGLNKRNKEKQNENSSREYVNENE